MAMTMPGMNPEDFPGGGEYAEELITLDSRAPQIVMPRDSMWPLKLHDPATRAAVTEILPKLVAGLSEPVEPASEEQIRRLFDANPHDRQMPWICRKDSMGLTYSTAAYEGRTNDQGSTPLYYGINYTFDQNGRLIKYESIEGERSYQRHQPNYQEFLSYDEDGYLIGRTTWGYTAPTATDRFDYAVDESGRKVPVKMTRALKTQADGYDYQDGKPMTVDLANYEEWIATNPNGFTTLTPEQLRPKEVTLENFAVSEDRKGILFFHPEQLEHALVMYGNGRYATPGGQTELERNVQSAVENYGKIGGGLLAMFAFNGDMLEFVGSGIMDEVRRQWNQIAESPDQGATERVYFDFDYNGAGHFQKTSGEVAITKKGLELTLKGGGQVEDQLASALGVQRGLRSATITIPVNQTEHEGHFFVDVKAICEKLGIPATDEDVTRYLSDYLFENSKTPVSSYERKYGEQPVLWEDEATGVKVELITERSDFDSRTDLDLFFRRSNAAIWGPRPRGVYHVAGDDGGIPKIRIQIKPSGDPFAQESVQRTDEILRSYTRRLEESA